MKMNKLDVVQFLIEEIEYEQTLPQIIAADRKQATEKADKFKKENVEDGYYRSGGSIHNYLKYDGRNYSATRIKDNCKKIRQILLDISKEVK